MPKAVSAVKAAPAILTGSEGFQHGQQKAGTRSWGGDGMGRSDFGLGVVDGRLLFKVVGI